MCQQTPCGSSVPCGNCPPVVADPCRSSGVCDAEIDAGCVRYHAGRPNSLSQLDNLGMPSDSPLEAILEAIDEKIGELEETSGTSESGGTVSIPLVSDNSGLLSVDLQGTGINQKRVITLNVANLLSVIRSTPQLRQLFEQLVAGTNLQSY